MFPRYQFRLPALAVTVAFALTLLWQATVYTVDAQGRYAE
jgi:hypothetical protein